MQFEFKRFNHELKVFVLIQNEDLSVNFKLVNWPQKGGHISGPALAFQRGLSLDLNSKTFSAVLLLVCCGSFR